MGFTFTRVIPPDGTTLPRMTQTTQPKCCGAKATNTMRLLTKMGLSNLVSTCGRNYHDTLHAVVGIMHYARRRLLSAGGSHVATAHANDRSNTGCHIAQAHACTQTAPRICRPASRMACRRLGQLVQATGEGPEAVAPERRQIQPPPQRRAATTAPTAVSRRRAIDRATHDGGKQVSRGTC